MKTLVVCRPILCLLWGSIVFMADNVYAQEVVRHIQESRQLSPFEVFEWGLSQHGERYFALHGRLTRETSAEEGEVQAKWMYRGQFSQKVEWLKRKPEIEQTAEKIKIGAKLDQDFVTVGPPADFDALNVMYLAIDEQIKLTSDSLSHSPGYTLKEQRIFQAFAPYHLIALKRTLNRSDTLVTEVLYQGKWVSTSSDSVIKTIDPSTVENLSARLWSVRPYHVGGGYTVNLLQNGVIEEVELKVIDRRFERQSGVWGEVSEWRVPHFLGIKGTRVVLNQRGMIRSVSLGKDLFAVPLRPSVFARLNLPEHKKPWSLSRLHKQVGTHQQVTIEEMTAPARPHITQCLESLKTESGQYVVIRLNLNHVGRLISAGATSHLSWTLTRCLLKSLAQLKFPKPDLRDKTLKSTLLKGEQGANLAWPLYLDQYRLSP